MCQRGWTKLPPTVTGLVTKRMLASKISDGKLIELVTW
jgi:hypothetical protein